MLGGGEVASGTRDRQEPPAPAAPQRLVVMPGLASEP